MRARLLALLAVVGCTHKQTIGDGRSLIGKRVRVEIHDSEDENDVAGVVAEDRSGITVSTGSGDFSLWETHKVTVIDHGRGALEGLGLGVLIGGGGGALLGYSAGDDNCDPSASECFLSFTAGEKAVITGVFFGGLGALLGLLIGAARGSRDEYTIGGSAPPTPHFTPSGPPGSAIGATLHF